ncbi:hypothetical protein BXZ70DRAFT_500910 [Cristinia sonorae]|uniref:DUF6534 domain-containing protein n=1 Tax=Cristinia sonorae TaxID=1940300 RepID=A0A8K0XLD9_9AGAR|nr:hypothetical protein BXZ70DRAFT_500910 [Cristinia sonorae]
MTCLLMGILIVQIYLYYAAFPHDHWRVKTVVAISFVVECAQIAFALYDAYRVFGYGWGIAVELDRVGFLWIDVTLCTGLAAMLSRMFYAWRIRALSQRYLIPGFVFALSILQMVFSIWSAVKIIQLQHLSLIRHSILSPVGDIWLSTIAVCDITITCSIFYYLWKAKKLSLNGRTNSILSRLMRLTIETGFITSTFAILALIFSVVYPDNLLYTCFMGITSKLYANTLVAVLNSRIHVTGSRDKVDNVHLSLMNMNTSHGGSLKFAPSANGSTTRHGDPTTVFTSGIVIESTQVGCDDDMTVGPPGQYSVDAAKTKHALL